MLSFLYFLLDDGGVLGFRGITYGTHGLLASGLVCGHLGEIVDNNHASGLALVSKGKSFKADVENIVKTSAGDLVTYGFEGGEVHNCYFGSSA